MTRFLKCFFLCYCCYRIVFPVVGKTSINSFKVDEFFVVVVVAVVTGLFFLLLLPHLSRPVPDVFVFQHHSPTLNSLFSRSGGRVGFCVVFAVHAVDVAASLSCPRTRALLAALSPAGYSL